MRVVGVEAGPAGQQIVGPYLDAAGGEPGRELVEARDLDARVCLAGGSEWLLDENATCHIALGAAYPAPIPGAGALDEAGRMAIGVNVSTIHLDVMIGGDDVDVDGIGADDSVTPVLRDNSWVLD